jgi:DNA-binding CsgD family transcriptional regulator
MVAAFAQVRRMLCPSVVGRAAELSWLSAALDGLEEGRGGCVFLVGEPGIGKSRLADEAIAEAERRGIWVLSGRASPTGRAVPYQSLSGAVLHGLRSRPLIDVSKADGVRAGLATLLPGFFDGPAIDPSPVLLGETLLRLVSHVAADDGALVVLEDLHWACGDTLAVTEYLADNAAGERVVVVGTLRPEGVALDLVDALERRGSATLMALRPLSSAETSEMVAACLAHDGAAVPGEVAKLLDARAEGLPFLVEELLAGLISRGSLVESAPGWELHGELDSVDVPLSFSQTVHERMAELPGGDRRVVESAALLGRDFDWSHLTATVPADELEVLRALSLAVDLQLVEEAGGDRFRFRHALTVEAILAEMLDPERLRAAARALDNLVPDSEQVRPELLEVAAHLATQAGRGADAARYLTEEARGAIASGALATAIATARRARSRVPAREPEALAAGEVLVSALSLAGNSAAVEEVGSELLSALQRHGASAERQATVRLQLARASHAALGLDRARMLCEEALSLDPADRRLRIELDLMLAEIAFSEHQHAAAVAGAETVLADADAAGLPDLACDALELIGRHRMFIACKLEEARPYLLEALRRADAANLPLARLRVLGRLAFYDLNRNRGSARMEQGRALALELGALASVVEFDHVLATHYVIADELEAAANHTERALAEARRYGLRELTVLLLGLRALISAVEGHREVAERQAAEAGAAAEGLPFMRPAVSGTPLVVAALADDDLSEAARRLTEIRALMPEQLVFWPPFLGSFYGVASVVTAAAGARELVEGRDWVRVDDIYQHSSFCVAQAILAGRAGAAERAAALFAEGDDGLVSVPWVRALYRRYAGEAALADGWGDPAGWLAEAEVYLENRGNEPLARACRSLLRLAGTSPRRQRTGPAETRYPGLELTTREADVLALLADGLTNKEIAGRLYLSPRTVEKHVERILAKTNQPNRTALAAYATERPSLAAPT